MLAAPLLLIAVGLIVVFRANIWNLGYDGQYLLGAALITGVAPHLESLPNSLSLVILFAVSMAAGAAWTIIPALLKARYQTNEIITTLMMSFIGIGVANILVKGPFQDPTVNIPQTRVIPFDHMLPPIPGTRIHVGVLVALGVALLAYYVLTRTSFGLRLHVLGANPRAAAHMGVDTRGLIVRAFLTSTSTRSARSSSGSSRPASRASWKAGGRRSTSRTCPRPPDGIPQNIADHMRLMCDILVLGFQTDTTRVCTLKLNNDHSSLRFPHLGVDYMIHHLLSHSDTADWLKVNQFFLRAGRLHRAQARRDPGRASGRCSTTRCCCTARAC